MSRYDYPLELAPDDNGTFLVTCPSLPEVTSFGESEAEAHANGRLAVAEAVAARLSRFEEIPPPAANSARGKHALTVSVPLRLQPKVALLDTMLGLRLSRADLVRRTGWPRNSVDRLFDPAHNSRLERIEQAFRALDVDPPAFISEPVRAG